MNNFSKPSFNIIVDSAVADIINDFNSIAFANGLFPKLVSVVNDKSSQYPLYAYYKVSSIPNYEILRLLNRRFNKVVITVHHECNIDIEVYDDTLPF